MAFPWGSLPKAMSVARWEFLNVYEMLPIWLITAGNQTAVFNILMLITWKAVGKRKERTADCIQGPGAYLCLNLRDLLRTGWLPSAAVLILLRGQGCTHFPLLVATTSILSLGILSLPPPPWPAVEQHMSPIPSFFHVSLKDKLRGSACCKEFTASRYRERNNRQRK